MYPICLVINLPLSAKDHQAVSSSEGNLEKFDLTESNLFRCLFSGRVNLRLCLLGGTLHTVFKV